MSRCQLKKDHPVVMSCFSLSLSLNDQPVLIRLYYCFGQSDAHQTEGVDPNPSLPPSTIPSGHRSAVKQGQQHGLNSKEIDFRQWGWWGQGSAIAQVRSFAPGRTGGDRNALVKGEESGAFTTCLLSFYSQPDIFSKLCRSPKQDTELCFFF